MPYQPDPHVSTPSDDTVIRRYLSIPQYLSILENEWLYFNRADMFDDPFEGSIPKLNGDIREAQFEDGSAIDSDDFAIVNKALRKTSFANCWHCNVTESASMWDRYSGKSGGVAIETTVGDLIDSVEDESKGVYIGEVNYINYDSDTIPADSPIAPLFYKRENYRSEEELRAVVTNPPVVEPERDDDADGIIPAKAIVEGTIEPVPGHHLFVEPDELINEVRVAPSAPQWIFRLIESISESYGIDRAKVSSSSIDRDPTF